MGNPPHAASEGAPLPASVLIADNDRSVGGLLADVLDRHGIPVARAFDGDAARVMARAESLRVVVCDLDMPGASGLEVVESLADLAQPPSVVVVSGYIDADVEASLQRWPFVRAILRKPFDLLAFAERVRGLLSTPGSGASGPEF